MLHECTTDNSRRGRTEKNWVECRIKMIEKRMAELTKNLYSWDSAVKKNYFYYHLLTIKGATAQTG